MERKNQGEDISSSKVLERVALLLILFNVSSRRSKFLVFTNLLSSISVFFCGLIKPNCRVYKPFIVFFQAYIKKKRGSRVNMFITSLWLTHNSITNACKIIFYRLLVQSYSGKIKLWFPVYMEQNFKQYMNRKHSPLL